MRLPLSRCVPLRPVVDWAEVDTGADLDHPDLKGRLVDGYDFVDNDDEPQDLNAADQDGRPASFTNFGAKDAVSAPGVGILSTLPTYTTKETPGLGNVDAAAAVRAARSAKGS